MLKYMRSKLISIMQRGSDLLIVHGVLDDDVYNLEIDVSIGIQDLEIKSLEGKWGRYTSPECPRAIPMLQEAVGYQIEADDFDQKVHKVVGRKACRHFANLLLECCHSAKEAVMLVLWEKEKESNPELSFDDYRAGRKVVSQKKQPEPKAKVEVRAPREEVVFDEPVPIQKHTSDGFIIDIHMHTYPASQCSIISVDDIIREAKHIGLDGICLTDHNYVWSPDDVDELRQRHGYLVLRGNEITTDQGDVLVFGLERDIKGIISLEDLRKEALAADAFMIVAHPFRGFLTFGPEQVGLTPEKAMERPMLKLVDAVEILNGKVTPRENDFAAKVAAGLHMKTTGGSDAHERENVGKYATQFQKKIENEQELLAALKEGNYRPVSFRKEMVSGL